MTDRISIFDGHNDVVQALVSGRRGFFERSSEGHLDLPRARAGGLGGGLFAIFVRSPGPGLAAAGEPKSGPYEAPLSPTPDPEDARGAALAMMACLLRLERESDGTVRIVRTALELEDCLQNGTFAVLMHLEGAECIDPDFATLEVFHAAGLRSLGPVWSRPNAFGHGVPFAFPRSPDTGPGLTDLGCDLVRTCNRLRIAVDLSHLNERGFWDVASLSDAPLIATHSNAHAICAGTRNLTDRQLEAIRESDGMVGVNFHVRFLRPDGQGDPDTPLDLIARHVDYLVEKLGIDRVGFGSDFDGATMPAALGDAAGMPALMGMLRSRGYDEASLRKLAHENWVRVLRRTWGE